jgi:trimethyllysine dioxygenase
LQLFHLLSHENGTGGATLLVDGFYVASILKELHPDAYDLLSRVPIPAHAAGEPSELFQPSPPSGYPVLSHDTITEDLTQVRWNNDDRSVMNALDPHFVEEWYTICLPPRNRSPFDSLHRYNAIRTWHKFLTSSDSEYWVQLTPGTAVSMSLSLSQLQSQC